MACYFNGFRNRRNNKIKKLDLFNAILTLIGVIYLLSGLKIIGNINGRLIFAIILIGAGISFILSSLGKKKVKNK